MFVYYLSNSCSSNSCGVSFLLTAAEALLPLLLAEMLLEGGRYAEDVAYTELAAAPTLINTVISSIL